MAGYKLRSWQKHSVGRLAITVLLEPPADKLLGQQVCLESATNCLLERLNAERLPATWAASDPAHAAATVDIVTSGIAAGLEHEMAILGDPSWVGPQAGRPRFAKELERRVLKAHSKGLNCSTLLLRDTMLGDNLDLVVRHGITAIVPAVTEPQELQPSVMPRTLHYGLWESRFNAKVPMQRRWFESARLRRQLHAAGEIAATFHLGIDLPAVAQRGAERSLNALLGKIIQLCQRGHFRPETVSRVSAWLSDVPAVPPQRSILSVAA